MTPTDREHLVTNIVAHLGDRVERFIQERAVNEYWAWPPAAEQAVAGTSACSTRASAVARVRKR
jgi:hypothetical protein